MFDLEDRCICLRQICHNVCHMQLKSSIFNVLGVIIFIDTSKAYTIVNFYFKLT